MYKIESVENWNKESYFEVHTYFEKRIENTIHNKSSPKSNNIHTKSNNVEYKTLFEEYVTKMNQLKIDLKLFYESIKEKTSDLPLRADEEDIVKVDYDEMKIKPYNV